MYIFGLQIFLSIPSVDGRLEIFYTTRLNKKIFIGDQTKCLTRSLHGLLYWTINTYLKSLLSNERLCAFVMNVLVKRCRLMKFIVYCSDNSQH